MTIIIFQWLESDGHIYYIGMIQIMEKASCTDLFCKASVSLMRPLVAL